MMPDFAQCSAYAFQIAAGLNRIIPFYIQLLVEQSLGDGLMENWPSYTVCNDDKATQNLQDNHLKIKAVILTSVHYLGTHLLAFGEVVLSTSKFLASGVAKVIGKVLELNACVSLGDRDGY